MRFPSPYVRMTNRRPRFLSDGWRYHHIGIPTLTPQRDERYLETLKMYVSGFETSPYGIEWMRFEPDSPVSELIRTVPHVAFEVDNLEAALAGRQILSPPARRPKGSVSP